MDDVKYKTNTIDRDRENNKISGNGGNDSIFGGNNTDQIRGNSGKGHIDSCVEVNKCNGGTDKDTLVECEK